MPKMKLICDYCGKEYTSYQCGKYNHFCSLDCRHKGAHLMSQNITQKDRERRRQQIIRINKTINNDPEHVKRRRLSILKNQKSKTKGYKKFYGIHEHRIIAEKKIGRKLKSGEIVHHIDGDKSNNDPSNLEVMTQSEHIREHLRRGGGRLA